MSRALAFSVIRATRVALSAGMPGTHMSPTHNLYCFYRDVELILQGHTTSSHTVSPVTVDPRNENSARPTYFR